MNGNFHEIIKLKLKIKKDCPEFVNISYSNLFGLLFINDEENLYFEELTKVLEIRLKKQPKDLSTSIHDNLHRVDIRITKFISHSVDKSGGKLLVTGRSFNSIEVYVFMIKELFENHGDSKPIYKDSFNLDNGESLQQVSTEWHPLDFNIVVLHIISNKIHCKLIDVSSKKTVDLYNLVNKNIRSISWSPKGKQISLCDDQLMLHTVDWVSATLKKTIKVEYPSSNSYRVLNHVWIESTKFLIIYKNSNNEFKANLLTLPINGVHTNNFIDDILFSTSSNSTFFKSPILDFSKFNFILLGSSNCFQIPMFHKDASLQWVFSNENSDNIISLPVAEDESDSSLLSMECCLNFIKEIENASFKPGPMLIALTSDLVLCFYVWNLGNNATSIENLYPHESLDVTKMKAFSKNNIPSNIEQKNILKQNDMVKEFALNTQLNNTTFLLSSFIKPIPTNSPIMSPNASVFNKVEKNLMINEEYQSFQQNSPIRSFTTPVVTEQSKSTNDLLKATTFESKSISINNDREIWLSLNKELKIIDEFVDELKSVKIENETDIKSNFLSQSEDLNFIEKCLKSFDIEDTIVNTKRLSTGIINQKERITFYRQFRKNEKIHMDHILKTERLDATQKHNREDLLIRFKRANKVLNQIDSSWNEIIEGNQLRYPNNSALPKNVEDAVLYISEFRKLLECRIEEYECYGNKENFTFHSLDQRYHSKDAASAISSNYSEKKVNKMNSLIEALRKNNPFFVKTSKKNDAFFNNLMPIHKTFIGQKPDVSNLSYKKNNWRLSHLRSPLTTIVKEKDKYKDSFLKNCDLNTTNEEPEKGNINDKSLNSLNLAEKTTKSDSISNFYTNTTNESCLPAFSTPVLTNEKSPIFSNFNLNDSFSVSNSKSPASDSTLKQNSNEKNFIIKDLPIKTLSETIIDDSNNKSVIPKSSVSIFKFNDANASSIPSKANENVFHMLNSSVLSSDSKNLLVENQKNKTFEENNQKSIAEVSLNKSDNKVEANVLKTIYEDSLHKLTFSSTANKENSITAAFGTIKSTTNTPDQNVSHENKLNSLMDAHKTNVFPSDKKSDPSNIIHTNLCGSPLICSDNQTTNKPPIDINFFNKNNKESVFENTNEASRNFTGQFLSSSNISSVQSDKKSNEDSSKAQTINNSLTCLPISTNNIVLPLSNKSQNMSTFLPSFKQNDSSVSQSIFDNPKNTNVSFESLSFGNANNQNTGNTSNNNIPKSSSSIVGLSSSNTSIAPLNLNQFNANSISSNNPSSKDIKPSLSRSSLSGNNTLLITNVGGTGGPSFSVSPFDSANDNVLPSSNSSLNFSIQKSSKNTTDLGTSEPITSNVFGLDRPSFGSNAFGTNNNPPIGQSSNAFASNNTLFGAYQSSVGNKTNENGSNATLFSGSSNLAGINSPSFGSSNTAFSNSGNTTNQNIIFGFNSSLKQQTFSQFSNVANNQLPTAAY